MLHGTHRQGRLGELLAETWLTLRGYDVYRTEPTRAYDLLAVRGQDVLRVQVKTTASRRAPQSQNSAVGRQGQPFVLTLRRSAGRGSTRVNRAHSRGEFDVLFVVTPDGAYHVPADVLGGTPDRLPVCLALTGKFDPFRVNLPIPPGVFDTGSEDDESNCDE